MWYYCLLLYIVYNYIGSLIFWICREWDEVRAHLSMCDSSRTTVAMNNLLTHGLVFCYVCYDYVCLSVCGLDFLVLFFL